MPSNTARPISQAHKAPQNGAEQMTERKRLCELSAEVEELLEPLTIKQQLFVREYLVDLNATQAAIRAGYSKKSAQVIGSENLSKPLVWAPIEAALALKVERIDISADLIEQEYWRLFKLSLSHDSPADRSVARACLKDLGDYHAMFVKQMRFLDGGELEGRLAAGRRRMNKDHRLSPSRPPAPNTVQ